MKAGPRPNCRFWLDGARFASRQHWRKDSAILQLAAFVPVRRSLATRLSLWRHGFRFPRIETAPDTCLPLGLERRTDAFWRLRGWGLGFQPGCETIRSASCSVMPRGKAHRRTSFPSVPSRHSPMRSSVQPVSKSIMGVILSRLANRRSSIVQAVAGGCRDDDN